MSINDSSNKNLAWIRFKKNKAAFLSLFLIIAFFLIALFAYQLAPDSSPNANRIILEIGGQKPGFTQLFFKFPKNDLSNENGIFSILTGTEETYTLIPINSYRISNDIIFLDKYVDEGLSEEQNIPLQTLDNAKPIESFFTKKKFYMGTDKFGRDIFSRLLIGTRISLAVGIITVLISLTIGLFLGAVAGYFRGWVDEIIVWLINVVWSIPTLLLVFAFTLLLGKGFWQIFLAVGLTMWVNVARIVRGQILNIRELEYIDAAKVLGFSSQRIIFKHILPNIMGPVLVIASANFASAILIEAGLSFLGLGVQPPMPSWGLMIKENYNFIITNNPFLAIAPGIAIMLLVLAFNLLGNGMRDALNVKAKI